MAPTDTMVLTYLASDAAREHYSRTLRVQRVPTARNAGDVTRTVEDVIRERDAAIAERDMLARRLAAVSRRAAP